MPPALTQDLEALRQALLKLQPTGETGFEGLLAVVFTEVTGVPFRLAASGDQRGLDVANDPEGGFIAIEGKLYKGRVPGTELKNKVADLIARDRPPELWVVGSTGSTSAQTVEVTQAAARKGGIALGVLDWPSRNQVSPLAATCTLASAKVAAFLAAHAQADEQALAPILNRIALDPTCHAIADGVRTLVSDASLGLALARPFNRRWLAEAFADRRRAKGVFGSALAPNASGAIRARARPAISRAVAQALPAGLGGAVITLLGGEGAGKSWAMAQAVLNLSASPLTLLVPAGAIATEGQVRDFDDLFIRTLAQQAGDADTEAVRQRWGERLDRWRRQADHLSPRFVLCVDGLNEQPTIDWGRCLDHLAERTWRLGGVLVCTCREAYFSDHVRNRLTSDVAKVLVPDWSPEELAEILRELSIDVSDADEAIRERLRNPRLLSIGVELLKAGRLESISELSIERLLFEHIRAGEMEGHTPESAARFVNRLASHARAVLDRGEGQDDREIFSRALGPSNAHELTDALMAVSSERYFHPLAEDPTRYRLSSEGFALALGLALIEVLQVAERNSRDLDSALQRLLDPIASLDKTADALWAAVLVAAASDHCSPGIRKTLLVSLLDMQNLDFGYLGPFQAAVRSMIAPGMEAMREIATREGHVAHKDWLIRTLTSVRSDASAWDLMGQHIERWLRTYSLAPGLRGATSPTDEKHKEELSRRSAELDKEWAGLGDAERDWFQGMERVDGVDPGALFKVAYELLAGMPLASFAEALVSACLSEALNCALLSPYDDLKALLRFNAHDWEATRRAMLEASAWLDAPGVSEAVGKWALVHVLRGLGTAEDRVRENALINVLTREQEWFAGGRLIERWCASDPCDPTSETPDNIVETADLYRNLDFSLEEGDPRAPYSFFVKDALPGIARFVPGAALEAHRNKARADLERSGRRLKQDLVDIGERPGFLDRPLLERLIQVAKTLSGPRVVDDLDSSDTWVAGQHALAGVFPHLDGDAQAELLRSLPAHGSPMLDLFRVMKPASAATLDSLLDQAACSNDQNQKLDALGFAAFSGSIGGPVSRRVVSLLAKDDHSAVRSLAFDTILRWDDQELIADVAASGWSATGLTRKDNYFEIHSGGRLLIRALELGILQEPDLLDRVAFTSLSAAAPLLSIDARVVVAGRLSRALERAVAFGLPFRPPPMERIEHDDATHPPFLTMDHARSREWGGKTTPGRESPEAFWTRHQATMEKFDRFDDALTAAGARLIVDRVTATILAACIEAAPEWGEGIAATLLSIPAGKLGQVRGFGLRFARALAESRPDRAVEILQRMGHEAGGDLVSDVRGISHVSLEALCVWGGPDHSALNALRFSRLDRALNDKVLADEVLAALHTEKQGLLERYARERLSREGPAHKARALMVLGLTEPSELAQTTFAAQANQSGWLANVAEAAKGAYDRNLWTRHWAQQLRQATSAEQHWAVAAVFLKIVDGRYAIWSSGIGPAGEIDRAFGPGLRADIGHRVKAWERKRESTLFGQPVPGESFVLGNLPVGPDAALRSDPKV